MQHGLPLRSVFGHAEGKLSKEWTNITTESVKGSSSPRQKNSAYTINVFG